MPKTILAVALSLCALGLATGCATITRGTTDLLVVESEPAGAEVRLSTGLTGTTPCTFRVSRKGGFVVKITKPGYETVEVQVSSKPAGAAGTTGTVILGDYAIFGSLIGAAVDIGTGATRDVVPNPIVVKMVPLESEDAEGAEGT
ncbi:MAG: PEGA domain-containing protein [Thermoanaerobaculia bacterium]